MAHSLIQRTNLLLVLLVFLCRSSDSTAGPKLIRELKSRFKFVVKGYSVDLDCRFKEPYSLDDVTLSTEVDKSTLKFAPRNVDGVKITKSGQIFTINDFQESDEGQYWCKVHSSSTKIERLYLVSRTQPGNYILTQSTVPENITTVNEGDNVTIVCKVSGNGIKRVEWYKDKIELYSRYNNTEDFNVSIAHLTAVTVSQAGEYECRTSIIRRSYVVGYQAESVTLQVTGFHFLAKNKKYQRLFVGDKVTINCKTNVQKATSTLWVRKDVSPAKQVIPNGSTITSKGSRFLLSSLTQDDAGSYVCKATSSLLSKTIEEEITTLLIFTDNQSKPLAQVYPVFEEVFSGQNVNISCQAPSNAVSMEWSRKGQIVSSVQTHRKIRKTAKGIFTESTLMLTNVTKVNNGTYLCTVTTSQNLGYSNQATATLLVIECLIESQKFGDRRDPYGYFECTHGTAVKKSCPVNHVWNQEDKECKIPPLAWVLDNSGKLYKITDTHTPFELDCRLNDPKVTVTLKKGDHNMDLEKNISVTQIGQKFIIDVSSLTDGTTMKLKCQAIRSGGQVGLEKTVTLQKPRDFRNYVYVEFHPKCLRGPLAIHDSISIICNAKHYGEMGWYKIDKSSNVRKAINVSRLTYDTEWTKYGYWNASKTLTLNDVTKNDEGSYVCWKSNGHNITKNITVYIDVADPSPATIENLDSPQWFIKEGQNVRFHCTVSGSPRPKVTWKRGREIVASCAGKYNSACETFGSRYKANWRDDRGCMNRSMGPTSGGWVSWLNVKDVQSPADVNYTCVVENGRGQDKKVASLKIAVVPVLQRNSKDGPDRVYGPPDVQKEIKCITERSNPPASFKWLYQPLNCSLSSSSCPKPTNNWTEPTQLGIVINSSDDMSVLILPGYITNMYFKCIAEENRQTRAKDSKIYQFMRQTGEEGSSLFDVKPEPYMDRSEGSNITLRCEASVGYFSGQPSWNFGGKTFDNNSNNRKYVNTFKDKKLVTELVIRDANPSDSGRYVCSAALKLNNGGELRESINLTVIEFSKPKVNISSNVTGSAGQTAELSCEVTGNPRPEISWLRNGEKIERTVIDRVDCEQYKSGFYEIKGEVVVEFGVLKSRLVMCSATHISQTGSYTCYANNSIGNDAATAYVNIYEKPTVRVKSLGEVESGITELSCTATGNPTPSVYWEKKDSGGSFVLLQKRGGRGMKNVNVIRVKMGSEDLYRCVATNIKGNDSGIWTEPTVDTSVQRPNDGGISKESTIVMIVCVGFVVIVFFLLCLILYKRKKKYGGFYLLTLPPSPDYIMKLDPERSLLEQTNKLPYDAQWEFPRERVHIAKPLGSGAFGQVFLAQATGIVAFDPRGSTKRKPGRRRSRFGSTSRPYYNDKRVTAVAVKSLKDNATEAEYRDLLSELKILIHIGEHKNIVNLLGACTKGMERELWVIIEYCPHGNLLDFLRKRRDIFEPVWTTPTEHADVTFTTIDLYICSLQVARAMEFLTSRRCVHRDLAARNVLVGENYVLKVADFGLARDIYKEEHYVKTTAGLLPVKWMAIEALVDRIYTHKSDVWSFGVLLWELFTLGGSPYPGLPANEVYQYLMEGQRMENPLNCPDEMYEVMRNCWEHSPDERPSFTDLVARVDKLLEVRTSESGEGYLDLEHVEDEPNLDEPTFEDEYLDPGERLLPSPGSPTSEERMNYPLPPLPSEEIEMDTFEEPIKDEEKKKFVLLDPPREKRIVRMDSELEKVRKDTLEREKPKESVGHYNEDEFISEKEHLRSDDDDKDICERNSGVFEFPPVYEARHSLDVPPQDNAYYGEQRPPSQGEVTLKAGNGFRGRQPSNRYVNT